MGLGFKTIGLDGLCKRIKTRFNGLLWLSVGRYSVLHWRIVA